MSVRVNLLPQEQFARAAAARQRNSLIAGVALVLAILVALTLWQNGRVRDAEDRLAEEQALLASLQAEVAQLNEFAELEERIDRSNALIVQALGNEVSLASILQDVALVMPSDAQLDSFSINVTPEVPVAGIESTSLGTLTASGQTLNSHAPGLERLLLEFDKAAAFHDLFFTSSTLQDPDEAYASFTFDAQLGPEILTGRYVDGVPGGLR